MSKVLLIYCGGTIGMACDPESGALSPLKLDKILDEIPELGQFNFGIDCLSVSEPIDSSEIAPEDWDELVQIIQDHYDQYTGFVVMHGTDTMAFTASALSFALEGLNKPVVITGSQLPLGVIRTDGKENLISAIEIAGTAPFIQEVVVYFEYRLYRGNRCKKVSSAHFDAFRSPNYPALAECGINIFYNKHLLWHPKKELTFHQGFTNQLLVLTLYPGINLKGWKNIVADNELRIIIIRSFGSGNAPISNAYFAQLLEYCQNENIVVINSSQCSEGEISAETYETGAWQKEYQVVSARDMTFEAVVTKSMFLSAHTQSKEDFIQGFISNRAGELSINN